MGLLSSATTERRQPKQVRTGDRRGGRAEGDSGSVPSSLTFRLARVLFGGILAFMALDNFMNLEERVQYAEGKGVPNADVAVPFGSGALFFGGLGITFWKLPTLASGAVLTFFAAVTPEMHDFWELEGEQKQQQMVHFLKNAALFGAGLAFLRVASRSR